jgi:hypothetical protein
MHEFDTHQFVSPQASDAETGQPLHFPPDDHSGAGAGHYDLDDEFEQLFRPQDPYLAAPIPEEAHGAPMTVSPPVDRRRRKPRMVWARRSSMVGIGIPGATALVTGTVGVLGARVCYRPLRDLAVPTAYSLASLWPLLIYGPWTVACLSILHAAAHRRQVRAAWLVMLLFSAIAMALGIAHAPRTLSGIATAGLPPVSALVSFHLLFRQITLLHPRHAKLPRQRKH